jgi:hypothetical protein
MEFQKKEEAGKTTKGKKGRSFEEGGKEEVEDLVKQQKKQSV